MTDIKYSALKHFKPLFTTDKRIVDIWGGRGRGGSFVGTDYFLFKILTAPYFRGVFLRRVSRDIRHSLFQDFKDRVNEKDLSSIFKINENDMSVTCLTNGNLITAKGVVSDSGREAKLKSLAGYTELLIEEANEIEEADFNQITDSLRTTKAPIKIVRIFNPPHKDHWIWKDYNLKDISINIDGKNETFYTASPKSDSNIESIFSTYLDNIKNIDPITAAGYEKYKEKNPYHYYTNIRGLISTGARGRVYSGWDVISDSDFESIDCRPIYIIDFGYDPDPTALIQVKWKDNRVFVKELLYEYQMDDLMLAKRFHDLGITYRDTIIADYGNGGNVRINNFITGGGGAWNNIEGYPELKKGFSMIYAKKGAGSIEAGIKLVKSFEIYGTEKSKNLWSEYDRYVWSTDRTGESTGYPVDNHNHIMDCIRYFIIYKSALGL